MTRVPSLRITLFLRALGVLGVLPLAVVRCSPTGSSGNSHGTTLDATTTVDARIDTGHETLGDSGDCFAGHVVNGGACASDGDCCAVVNAGPVECVKAPNAANGTCRAGAGGTCSGGSACATNACDHGQCASSTLGGACGSGIDCSGLGAMCLGGTCGTFGGDAAIAPRDAPGLPPEDAGGVDAEAPDATSKDAAEDGAHDAGTAATDARAG